MSSSSRSKRQAIRCSLAAVLCTVLMHRAEAASEIVACIDQSSPAAAMDEKLVRAAAEIQGATVRLEHFDGSGLGDDPYSEKNFSKLATTRCQLVLGFPVDVQAPLLPNGVKSTQPYGQTGFAMVTRDRPPVAIDKIPAGTDVAVAYETAPNLFFLTHKNISPDVYPDNDEALAQLAKGKVKAAMLWAPLVVQYSQKHPKGHQLFHRLLDEPHARWDLVALYDESGAAAAALFDKGVAALRDSGRLAALLRPYAEMSDTKPAPVARSSVIVPAAMSPLKAVGLIKVANTVKKAAAGGKPPALFTDAQATTGQQVFMANCAMCHGPDLGGLSGPALKGTKFASPKDKFAVSDIFNIMATQMPAGRPGALAKDDYAAVMAFLLQQNGYPAGAQALTYTDAAKSKVPLIYRSN